ncbi:MAG: SIS domain-containing protein [Candidatus Zixiibacteriota bacterium]
MKINDRIAYLKEASSQGVILRKALVESLGTKLVELADVISGVLGSGRKLLLAGNGGSAADASHFAGEMIVRLSGDRNRQALPAIALCVDPSVMTAAANDYGYDNIFARQIEALGQKGDMFMAISTSGNSTNLVRAAHTARDKGLLTAGLLGNTGGKLFDIVDRPIVVPHPSTQRVQEEHIFIIHMLVEFVEQDLLNNS